LVENALALSQTGVNYTVEEIAMLGKRIAFASALAMLALVPVEAQQDAPPIAAPAATAEEEGTLIPGFAQEFDIDRSDRMTVPVSINGSETFPFIVDTGAERTVIANQLAKRLKLEQGPQLKLATITGPAFADSYMIENLSMNTINVEMIEAPGLEQQNLGAYGLLGIDSLEDHKVLLDFKNVKMDVLPSRKRAGLGKVEKGMIVVTAKRRAGRMILSDARIGGMKVEIILDTGAQSSMGNYALRDRLRNRDRRFDYVRVMMKSVTGDLLQGDLTQIKGIDIGGVTIGDLPVTFADNFAFKALKLEKKPAILLGMDALKLFDRVLVDFANRRVGFDLPKGVQREPNLQLAMN
jgi:predicted aspartyl protease